MGQLRKWRWQLAVLLFVGTARADLPVHCLHAQIAGNWIFYLGRRSPDNSTDRVPSCGAHAPGTKEDAMADPASVVGLDVTAYELSLEAPDVARDRAHTWDLDGHTCHSVASVTRHQTSSGSNGSDR